MYSQMIGVESINHYKFYAGGRWATHANNWNPDPLFLMLSLRYRAEGNLLDVNKVSIPKISIDPLIVGGRNTKTVPGRENADMVHLAPFRDGNKVWLMVYSRLVKDTANVRLKLPFHVKPNATIFTVTGDKPDLTNLKEMNVKIQESSINDFSNDYQLELPPHTFKLIEGAI